MKQPCHGQNILKSCSGIFNSINSITRCAFVLDDNTDVPHSSSPAEDIECNDSSDHFEDQSSNATSDTGDEEDDADENEHLPLTLGNHGIRALQQGALRKIQLQKVDMVPFDVNGTCGYYLTARTRSELLKICKDGRPWKKDSGTHWKGYDTIRYKNCNGSMKCPNLDCQYFIHMKTENRLNLDKNKMCSICVSGQVFHTIHKLLILLYIL